MRPHKIMDNLYVADGSADLLGPEWSVVHACKEPCHRRILGYDTKSAPKNNPEYLVARRGNHLYLNLIDAPTAEYIPLAIIQKAMAFIAEQVGQNKQVCVHCNQALSRSPAIAMLYMGKYTDELSANYSLAVSQFRNLYPPFNPGNGMNEFCKAYWDRIEEI